MFGWKMSDAGSVVKVMEDAVLQEFKLRPEAFGGEFGSHGARRALRFFPTDMSVETGSDDRGPFLQTAFTLPSGSYATVVLGEIMKTDVPVD